MAENEPYPTASDAANVETVEDSDDAEGAANKDAETAMETARAQAEARRKRILEKANNRMKFVNGEQVQDEEEKKASLSNAARIRAARQRRRGKKSTPASPTSATAAVSTTESSAVTETSTNTNTPEPVKADSDSKKETVVEASIEASASTDSATPAATADATGPTTGKKYLGVAKMRRKMLKKKQMEENTGIAAGSTVDNASSKSSLASSKGKSTSGTTSVGKNTLPLTKVQRLPIYMHMIVILLLFVAGFDVGIQQFHVDVDVRTKVAIEEYGVPFLHRNPWHPLKPITEGKGTKETLQEKMSSSSPAHGTGDLRDEFDEDIDEEYIPPNIDPIFRVDLDELTKGPGFLNQMARGAIAIHRLILWFFYYAPMGFFGTILSLPMAFIQSPPGLFLAAIFLRQVIGKGVLGAQIPEASGENGVDGTKQKNNIEVISMAKNFVKNFFMTTFPTLVKLYDVYQHLKADMYVVLCGLFFGLAWTHLKNDTLSITMDVDDSTISADISEGEL